MMQVPHGVWRALPGTLACSSLYPGSSPRSSWLLAPRTPALGPSPPLPVVIPWTKGSSWLQARPPTIPLSGFNRSPNSSAAQVTGPCLRRAAEFPQKHMTPIPGLELERSRGACPGSKGRVVTSGVGTGHARGGWGRGWRAEGVALRPRGGASARRPHARFAG